MALWYDGAYLLFCMCFTQSIYWVSYGMLASYIAKWWNLFYNPALRQSFYTLKSQKLG